MIAHLSKEDLAFIARNGGGLDMQVGHHSAEDLAFIARNMVEGSRFTLRGPSALTKDQLAFIARNGKGKVTFVA
jgi:hypothetical protein